MPAPDLETAELKLTGRITTASNATFLGSIGDVVVVYKPIAGESPLWDFPRGTLAQREVAAYLVSQVFGWDVVPHTWLRDGPMGEGMVQLWQEQDPAQSAVNLVATDHVPETGWKHVLEGRDENGRMVALSLSGCLTSGWSRRRRFQERIMFVTTSTLRRGSAACR